MISKITLVFVAMFIAQSAWSQISNVEPGSKWKEVRCNYWTSVSQGVYHVDNWRLSGDTTINNVSYKKLYNEQQDFMFGVLVGSEEDVLVSSSYYYYGAIREEDQKVFIYSEDFYEVDEPFTEKLMFDYSAAVGDTITIWCRFYYHDYIVEDIEPVEMMDGSTRNKFILGVTGPGMVDLSFIEGIGSNYGIIGSYIATTNDQMQHLLCYSINDTAMLENSAEYTSNCLVDPIQESCSTLTTSIENPVISEFSFSVYPNPTSDVLMVTIHRATHKSFAYRMYSPTGSAVVNGESLSSDELRIDVSAVPSGIYFLEMVLDDTERLVEKVVILD